MPRPRAGVLTKTCERCGVEFQTPDKKNYRERRYCSKVCSNAATAKKRADAIRAAGRYKPPICPCGNEVAPPPGQAYVYVNQKKYCSPECRTRYQKKRQRDPSKWRKLICLNCGEEFEQRVSSQSYGKYCSNACAQRHTKTKVHIVVDDAVVLDSTWEALFWGLCGFLKVPVERYDRDQGVEWKPGQWYAPDFRLMLGGLAVEVKGQADPEDLEKWMAYESQVGSLRILTTDDLEVLRGLDRETFLMHLHQDVPVV